MKAVHFSANGRHQSQFVAAVASAIEADLVCALDRRKRVLMLASGGNSPGPVLSILAQADVDWSRVIVTLTDDRCVPEDHPHSNARLIRETLLVGRAAIARFVPLWQSADVTQSVAVARLNQALGWYAPFDVALIGMGLDGHTASIFSDGHGMSEARGSQGPFAATEPHPLPPEAPWPRVTVTLPALVATGAIHLLLVGTEKMRCFDWFIADKSCGTPIAALFAEASSKLVVHKSQ